MYELDQITVSGDARSMGRQQGEALRDRVQSLLGHRLNEMTNYLADRSVDRMHRIEAVASLENRNAIAEAEREYSRDPAFLPAFNVYEQETGGEEDWDAWLARKRREIAVAVERGE